MNEFNKQMAFYGLNAYSFCLKGRYFKQTKTLKDLAKAICKYYSMQNPVNRQVVNSLLRFSTTKIIRTPSNYWTLA